MLSRTLQILLFFIFVGSIVAIWYWDNLKLKTGELQNGASFEVVDCWFDNPTTVRVECGYMVTRHSNPDHATFKLPVVVLRHSQWKNSQAPMLHIAGGPGGPAYIDAETMPYWLENFKTQNWGLDYVLYDQRGSGLSQPFLDCHDELQQLRVSADHIKHIGTDLSANDIADLQSLLSIKQWVLMGVSYGTRVALSFTEHFPQQVKSLVLDSVYPPEVNGFETALLNGLRGIDKILDLCESNTSCQTSYPDLTGQLVDVLDSRP